MCAFMCGRCQSLASQVNKQLREEVDTPENVSIPNKMRAKASDPLESLSRRVSAKLEDRFFKGAVHLAYSEDSLVESGETTFKALKDTHPYPHPDSTIPPPPSVLTHLSPGQRLI